MHLNPYGEYAVLLAASLANDWPESRAGIIARTREHGMTMDFPHAPGTTKRFTGSSSGGWKWWTPAPQPSAPNC